MSIEEIINAPVKLERLLKRLPFHEDDLESAAREQPGLYLEASRYRAVKFYKKMRAGTRLDLVKAEVSMQLRRLKKEKQTEKALMDSLLTTHEVKVAKRRFDKASEYEKWAEGLVEAFRQRLSVLKVIADIRNTEVSSNIRATKERVAMDTMRRRAEKARERYEALGEDEG